MARLTVSEFGRRLRAKEISAVEAVEASLQQIESENARLNAFILEMADEARAATGSAPTGSTADRCTAYRCR